MAERDVNLEGQSAPNSVETDNSSGEGSTPQGEKSTRHWVFWVNLVLAILIYLELDWWNRHVLRHLDYPFLGMLTFAHTASFLSWITGFFLISFGYTASKNPLQALSNPKQFIQEQNPDAYEFLSKRAITFGLLLGFVIVYGLIVFMPMDHFVYSGPEKPIVTIHGEQQRFKGHTISTVPLRAGSGGVIVSDEYGFFKSKIDAKNKAIFSPYYPFYGHRKIDLEKLNVRRNFKLIYNYVDQQTGKEKSVVQLFSYQTKQTFDAKFLPGISKPQKFLVALFKEVREPNNESYDQNTSGHLTFDGLTYYFHYQIEGDELSITIEPTSTKALLILNPAEGVEQFLASSESNRGKYRALTPKQTELVEQFGRDLKMLSTYERKRAYEDLWKTNKLRTARRGTAYQRQNALLLIGEIFGQSGHWLPQDVIDGYITEIEKQNLAENAATGEIALAVAAVCALASSTEKETKQKLLEKLEQYFRELKTKNNGIFPAASRDILALFQENSDSDLVQMGLKVIGVLWQYTNEKRRKEIIKFVQQEAPADQPELLRSFLANPAVFSRAG